jgi:hypothetical protein
MLFACAACSGESSKPEPDASAALAPSPPAAAGADTTATTETSPAVCNTLFDASEIPFVAVSFWISDACPSQRTGVAPMPSSTITRLTHQPGKICMSGQVTTGWAELVLDFSGNNPNGSQPPEQPAAALDAAGLGISQLRFTLDSPPASGLAANLASVLVPGCYGRPNECLHAGYYIMSEDIPGVPERLNEAGTYTLRIADFQAAPWVDPTRELDTSRLAFLDFEIGSGDYDFCIHDLQLLDDAGSPVAGRL